jgi:PTS system galactitol-specific IIA component
MPEIILSEELIKLGMVETDKAEAIQTLAAGFYTLDYVRDGYVENVIKREDQFPTGLGTSIPVALCHTEAHFVKQSALAVGTLITPISFLEMGSLDHSVNVEIIFLLALNDPKQQVPWLRKMASLFKDEQMLRTIKDSKDPKKLVEILKNRFID